MKQKKMKLALLTVLLAPVSVFAQQKISDGTANAVINPAAILELQSTNKGFLPSRVALTDRLSWAPMTGTATKGMVVYNTTTGGANGLDTGLVVWEGAWNPLSNSSQADYWRLTGNTGTIPPTTVGTPAGTANFLGTTDAQNLALATNDTTRAILDQKGNLVTGNNNTISNIAGTNNIISGSGNVLNYANNATISGQNNIIGGLNPNTQRVDNIVISGNNNRANSSNATAGLYTAIFASNSVDSNGTAFIFGRNDTSINSYDGAIFGTLNTLNKTDNIIVGGSNNHVIGSPGLRPQSSAVFGSDNIDSASYALISGRNNKLGTKAEGAVVAGWNNTVVPGSNWEVGNAVFGQENAITANYTGSQIIAGARDTITGNGYSAGSSVFGSNNTIVATTSLSGDAQQSFVAGIGNKSVNAARSAMFGTSNIDSASNSVVSGYQQVLGRGGSNSIVIGQHDSISTPAYGGFAIGDAFGSALFGTDNTITATSATHNAVRNIVAGGYNRVVDASHAAVWGRNNIDSASNTLMSGESNLIGSGGIYSVALGSFDTATAQAAIAIGSQNIATGTANINGTSKGAVAIGGGNKVTGFGNALGLNNIVRNGTAIGAANYVPGGIAIGAGDSVITNTYAFGSAGKLTHAATMFIGVSNNIPATASTQNNEMTFAENYYRFVSQTGGSDVKMGIGTTPVATSPTLTVNGSVSAKIRSLSTSASVAMDDYTIIATGTSAKTFTLPAPATSNGMILFVKDISTSGGSTTLSGHINGSASTTVAVGTGGQNTTQLQCDGTTWWVLMNN